MQFSRFAFVAFVGSLMLAGCVRTDETVNIAADGSYSYRAKFDYSQFFAMADSMGKMNSSGSTSSKKPSLGVQFAASGATSCANLQKKAPEGVTVSKCEFSETGIAAIAVEAASQSLSGSVTYWEGFGVVEISALRKALAYASSGAPDVASPSSSGTVKKEPSHPSEAKRFGMSATFVLRFPGKILFSGYGTKNAESELEIDVLDYQYEEPSPAFVVFELPGSQADSASYAQYAVKPVLKRDASKIPEPRTTSGSGSQTPSSLARFAPQPTLRPSVPTKPSSTPSKYVPAAAVAGISGPSFRTSTVCGKTPYVLLTKITNPSGRKIDAYVVCKPGMSQKAYPASTAKIRKKTNLKK